MRACPSHPPEAHVTTHSLRRTIPAAALTGVLLALLPAAALAPTRAAAQQSGPAVIAPPGGYDSTAFAALTWRELGP